MGLLAGIKQIGKEGRAALNGNDDARGDNTQVFGPGADAQYSAVQSNLMRSPEELQQSYSQGLDSSSQISAPQEIDNKMSALGMNTPEDFSESLSRVARNRHKETVRDLDIQNKYRAIEQSNNNAGVAFGNSVNKNEIKKQTELRRLQRAQERAGIRAAVISSTISSITSVGTNMFSMFSGGIGGNKKDNTKNNATKEVV